MLLPNKQPVIRRETPHSALSEAMVLPLIITVTIKPD